MLKRERRQPFGTRPVEVLEFLAPAGGKTRVDQEPHGGVVWTRRDRLLRLGLDPAQCVMLRVHRQQCRMGAVR